MSVRRRSRWRRCSATNLTFSPAAVRRRRPRTFRAFATSRCFRLSITALRSRSLPSRSIVDVAGLRGKRFGVTRFGGSLDFASRYFLKTSGLDPQRDVQLVQIGNTADILAALVNGTVDAGSLTFPYNFAASKLGYRQLADLSQSGARYATAAFLSKRKFLIDQRLRMQSFVKALG